MEKHPHRYPKHDGDKGQVHGGECNRTACTSKRAVFWNASTKGLYCLSCARGINHFDPVQLCTLVEDKPSLIQMEILEKDFVVKAKEAGMF